MYKFEDNIWLNPISLRLIFLKTEKDFLTSMNSLSESILIIKSFLKILANYQYIKFTLRVNFIVIGN